MTSMKAAIVIDRWKLPIFTRLLEEAGFSYEEVGALAEGTLTLIVETTEGLRLAKVVAAANAEAAASRKGTQ